MYLKIIIANQNEKLFGNLDNEKTHLSKHVQ